MIAHNDLCLILITLYSLQTLDDLLLQQLQILTRHQSHDVCKCLTQLQIALLIICVIIQADLVQPH